MTQLSLESAPDKSGTLVCGLTPSGRIDVRPGLPDDGPALSAAAAGRILDAEVVPRELHLYRWTYPFLRDGRIRDVNLDVYATPEGQVVRLGGG